MEHEKKVTQERQKQQRKQKVKRKIAFENLSSEESDEDLRKICNDSSDGEVLEDNTNCIEDNIISEGDFVLVKYSTNRIERFYVGKVERKDGRDDDMTGDENSIMKLPKPRVGGGTQRASRKIFFDVDLSSFNDL